MSSLQPYLIDLAVLVLATALSLLALKGERRKATAKVLVVLMTVLCATFLVVAVSAKKLAQTSAATAASQADMQLRIVAMFSSIKTSMFEGGGPSSAPPSPSKDNLEEQQLDKAEDSAIEALRKAIGQSPSALLYKAELAVLLGCRGDQSDKAELARLCTQLGLASGTDSSTRSFRELATVLTNMFVSKTMAKEEVSYSEQTIKAALPAGWYRDQALRQLFERTGSSKLLVQQQNAETKEYSGAVLRMGVAVLVALAALLVGLITIIWQFSVFSARAPELPDAVGWNMPWLILYGVFISWFSLQIGTGMILHPLIAAQPQLMLQPLLIASTTALTYLLCNISAPLLIYFLAVKPQNRGFRQCLHLTLRTSTQGPGKLVAAAFLGWCAAVPLVLLSALCAFVVFKAHGSDNPVLAQIFQTAGAANPLAILIFYLTLGVMAPFFEEILFRGFLYSGLKAHIGSAAAMVASAALFAVMHFDRGGFVSLFAIGLVLAFLYERTRSLVAPMICHGLWNSATFTAALLVLGS